MGKMLKHIKVVIKNHLKQVSIHEATKVLKKNASVDTQCNMYMISKQISRHSKAS